MADEHPTQKAEDPAPGEARAEAGDESATDLGLDGREAELEAELAAVKDRLLRALAEGENDRRRAARDREDAAKYGGTRLARDVLPVYDNLERALNSADEGVRAAAKDFFEGLDLTRAELLSAFGKHQIAPIDTAVGVKFDPNLHQAMFEVPLPGAEPGAIVQTMQTGFTIAGRLLRPALVGVAKAAPPAPAPAQPAPETSAEAAPDSAAPPAAEAPPAGEAASEAEDSPRSASRADGAQEAPPPSRPSGSPPPPPPPRPGAARTRRD